MSHLLIVDDDEDIRLLLKEFLERHSHTVTAVDDGKAMLAALEQFPVDLVILDVMLQGEDGFSLCQRLRSVSRVPIIMLTAMSDHTDRVVGLEVGADDYVVKPFDQRELLARIKAVLRRTTEMAVSQSPQQTRPKLFFGKWCLDLTRRELLVDNGMLVFLTSSEFDLLLAFVEHSQCVLTRDQLLETRHATYAAYDAPYDRAIDVQVSRLRRKLEDDPKNPSIIRTIRNNGYMFTLKVASR
jgi:two-component system OmpR family response regulator